MKEIIIINGSGGVGKDTFVEFCQKYCKVKNISSVDKVKEAARVLTGWDGTKDEKSRKLLVDLKQLGIEYNDAPFKYIVESAKEFRESEDEELMFVHIREISEIEKVRVAAKAKTLLVTNKNVPLITSNESDKNVMNYQYDLYIRNDGTLEELDEKAKDFVESFKSREEQEEELER